MLQASRFDPLPGRGRETLRIFAATIRIAAAPVSGSGIHAQPDRHALFDAHWHDRMERAAVAEA